MEINVIYSLIANFGNNKKKVVLPIYFMSPVIKTITHVHDIRPLVSLLTHYCIPTTFLYKEIYFTLLVVHYFACQENRDFSAETNLYCRLYDY
jgi:hypothetical protein